MHIHGQEAEEEEPLPGPLAEGKESRMLPSWLSDDSEGFYLSSLSLPPAQGHPSL